MSRWLLSAALVASVLSDGVVAACIDRVTTDPPPIITTEDSVALEIHIVTPSSPPHLAQPTEVTVTENEILVDLYADGGMEDMPGALLETVDLGTLPADTYTYQVVQHDTEYCWLQTVTGSFCVEDVDCQDEACRCPDPPGPAYAIIDLGALGGPTSVALGINDSGQVAGGADTAAGPRHAYLWDTGVMTDLGVLPPDPQSEAWDISNAGHVVGISTVDGGICRGFLWQDGDMIDLGDLGAPNTHAFGVNAAGQVVGFSWVAPSEPRAFLWQEGVMTDLGALGDTGSAAWDINDLGQVVGSTSLPAGEQGGAFLWEDGLMTNLGSLGGPSSGAYGINDLGQVVGRSERPEGGLVSHAFLWEDGGMIDLGALGSYDSSWAWGINDAGEAVGWGDGGWFVQPFLYDGQRGLRDLRDLIPADSGWSNLLPRDINDAGQIVGSGLHPLPHAFLATPIQADFDDDGDTDMGDFAAFQRCFAGPDSPIDPACQTRDIDRDGNIDLDDFRAFERVFAGPQG